MVVSASHGRQADGVHLTTFQATRPSFAPCLGAFSFDPFGHGNHPVRHMFDTLATALGNAYKSIVGQKTLTEANVDDGIRAVRQALLEADVNFQVAKVFCCRCAAARCWAEGHRVG